MQVKVTAYECDGCGRRIISDEEDYLSYGYHGTVIHIHEQGGTGTVEWYACRLTCVKRAVDGALDRDRFPQ